MHNTLFFVLLELLFAEATIDNYSIIFGGNRELAARSWRGHLVHAREFELLPLIGLQIEYVRVVEVLAVDVVVVEAAEDH